MRRFLNGSTHEDDDQLPSRDTRQGHIYHTVTATDHTRVHAGNVYADNLVYHELPRPTPRPQAIVPFDRDDDFVGREEILEKLDAVFSQNDKHNRFSLHGLGGIGSAFHPAFNRGLD